YYSFVSVSHHIFLSLICLHPLSTLFPYTTLFRSGLLGVGNTFVGPSANVGHMLQVETEKYQGTAEQKAKQIVDFYFDQNRRVPGDRKSTRLNSSHVKISYAVFCLKKKKQQREIIR